MGTHPRVLGESYPINTNIGGFCCFHKSLHPCALDESSLSIERVKKLSFEVGQHDVLNDTRGYRIVKSSSPLADMSTFSSVRQYRLYTSEGHILMIALPRDWQGFQYFTPSSWGH